MFTCFVTSFNKTHKRFGEAVEFVNWKHSPSILLIILTSSDKIPFETDISHTNLQKYDIK